MKKYILHILLVIPLLLIASVLFYIQTRTVNANPSSVQVVTNATSTTNSLATTSAQAPFVKNAAATSTLSFDPQNGDVIQVSFAIYSTSTPPTIYTTLQFSNNNIDWYSFEAGTTGNPDALLSGQVGDGTSFQAATTSLDQTVYKTVSLTNTFAALYGRLQYWTTGAGAQLHAEVAVKKQF